MDPHHWVITPRPPRDEPEPEEERRARWLDEFGPWLGEPPVGAPDPPIFTRMGPGLTWFWSDLNRKWLILAVMGNRELLVDPDTRAFVRITDYDRRRLAEREVMWGDESPRRRRRRFNRTAPSQPKE